MWKMWKSEFIHNRHFSLKIHTKTAIFPIAYFCDFQRFSIKMCVKIMAKKKASFQRPFLFVRFALFYSSK